MSNSRDHPSRLSDDEIFVIFDVVNERGEPNEARERIYRTLRLRRPHRITIARVFNVGVALFKRDPNAPVLTTQEAEEIAEKASYGVSRSRVVELQRLYELWKARGQHKKDDNSLEEQEKFLPLLQRWQEQVQFRSLYQLLDECLFQNRHEDLAHKIIESEEVNDLYLDGCAHHLEALPRPLKTTLLCEHTVSFKRLRDMHPESGVWQAQELFDQVCGGYFEAFVSWLVGVKHATESFCSRVTEAPTSDMDIEASTPWQVFNQVFNKAERIDRDLWLWSRLFTLTVACDVLALGIGEQERHSFWVPELDGIRKLRSTAVSTGTKELPKDYWQAQIISNGALLLAKRWKSNSEVKQKTEVLLATRRRLENAQSDVLVKLKKLEVSLSGQVSRLSDAKV